MTYFQTISSFVYRQKGSFIVVVLTSLLVLQRWQKLSMNGKADLSSICQCWWDSSLISPYLVLLCWGPCFRNLIIWFVWWSCVPLFPRIDMADCAHVSTISINNSPLLSRRFSQVGFIFCCPSEHAQGYMFATFVHLRKYESEL